jgi:hypothetical protein
MKSFNYKSGSVLLLTLFILTFVVVTVLGGATLALTSTQMASIQSHSTKAYFAAEAGAEQLLFRVRIVQDINLSNDIEDVIASEGDPIILNSSQAGYWVKFSEAAHLTGGDENIFTAYGSFLKTRRSVDIRF